MKVDLLRSPKALMFYWKHTLSSKITWDGFQVYTGLQPQVYRWLQWGKPMKSWGQKAKPPSYNFQQITSHIFNTLGSQGRCHTRSRLFHITTESTNFCAPSSFSHWTLIFKAKYLVLVQKPPLSGKTWEGVPRCSAEEGKYCRHITPPH